MNQITTNFTKDCLPDATEAAALLDAMSAHENRMIFAPQARYEQVKQLRLYQQFLDCEKHNDQYQAYSISDAIREGIRERYNDFVPFAEDAAISIFFWCDRFIKLYDHLQTNPELDTKLTQDSFVLCGNAWAKLQFVLAARHFNCNADILGFLVTTAWKEGKGQSIMTANFGPELSTSLFRASSEQGLNVLEQKPSKPVAKVLYRGGNMDPRLSHGMAWTEDRKTAEFFATRLGAKVPVILSTRTADNEILARYKHENEVVLPYDPKRPFQVEFV